LIRQDFSLHFQKEMDKIESRIRLEFKGLKPPKLWEKCQMERERQDEVEERE